MNSYKIHRNLQMQDLDQLVIKQLFFFLVSSYRMDSFRSKLNRVSLLEPSYIQTGMQWRYIRSYR